MSGIPHRATVDLPFLSSTQGLDYELIDAGEGRKLERFGKYILDRPEIEAFGAKSQANLWSKADFYFHEESGKKGSWQKNKPALEEKWNIDYSSQESAFKFGLELSNYKHIGIFPEQVANWNYIETKVGEIENCRFLNLFAYTSAASIVAAKAGAEVVNIEALKQLSAWSKENAALNNVETVKWLVDDVRTYVKRAIRRDEKFQGVIMDPPAFGYGSKGERWIIEKHLRELIVDVKKILDLKQFFIIINTYSPKMPAREFKTMIEKEFRGTQHLNFHTLGLENSQKKQIQLGNLARISSF